MKRVLIKEVAELADTSPATVSKVLNDVLDSRIPPETAERVRWAAHELRYVPLSSAQSLRRQRTQTISVITHDSGVLDRFTTELVAGIEASARTYGLTTVLATHAENSDLEAKHLFMGLRGQVDGLIIAPARANRNQQLYDELKEREIPFVFVDRYLPGYEVDYVGLRNEEAAYRLTRTLIVQGARIIGNITPEEGENVALTERLAGFRRALSEAGLLRDEDLYVPMSHEGAAQALQRLLARRPRIDGLFWISYSGVQPYLSILAMHDLHVPDDIRFAGFDPVILTLSRLEDYQALRVISGPWATAIQPGYEMGARAVEILAQHLAGAGPSTPQHIQLEPHYEWLADEVGDHTLSPDR
ncbi:MAG: LacI family DNA-binding transcriptional regulator [Anaerolineae bacterium]|nr:LacI family DNA-binding transcriptional regulator [Anaerolineae bacterium]